MSETDAGCHVRPPTAHNEGHPPFCSGSPTVSTIPSHWASFPPPRAPATFLPRSSLGQRSAERVEKGEKMMIKKKVVSGESRGGEQIHGTAWRPAWGHACHFSFHPFSLLAPAYTHLLYLGICGALLGCWREGVPRRGDSGGVGGTAGLCTSLAARQSAPSASVPPAGLWKDTKRGRRSC